MAGVEIPPWLKSLPLAPEFHPTEAEFADPIAYISKIEAEARTYGICKIVPPIAKVPKKTVIANLNRSLLQSLDAASSAAHGTASNIERTMNVSGERNASELGRSMGGSVAAGLGRSMSGSCVKNRGTLPNEVGVGGELKAKFHTRRQQLGWSSRRSKGQMQSLAQKAVWQSGESYTIEQFEAKAKQFARTRLRTSKELSPLVIEALFWKAAADKPITVEYGNDIPGSAFGEPLESETVMCPTSRSGKKRKRDDFRSDEPSVQIGVRKQLCTPFGLKAENSDQDIGLPAQIDDSSPQQRTRSGENSGAGRGVAKSASTSHKEEVEGVGHRNKIRTGDGGVEKEGGPGWKLATSPWNMRIVARSPGSLLRHMPDEVPGVTSPMVYIGMLFSWFAWHVEDHELHSLNYLHTGAPKTWYAVPGDVAPALEEVVRVFGYGSQLHPQAAFALLGEKTTVMSPEVLIAAGVPCCRLVQNAGEFIVTFPRAYHLGFSHGFNCGEAANFATPGWLEVAKDAATRRAAMNYLPMLSHQQLLYLLAMSFPASFCRIPLLSPFKPRSSRLKEKKRSLGEEIVKNVFVNDVAQNNRLLGLLLDEGVSSFLLLRDDGESSVADLGNSVQIHNAGVSRTEDGLKASCLGPADVTSAPQLGGISSDRIRKLCTPEVELTPAIKSNNVQLGGVDDHIYSQHEPLVTALSLEWGTLPCAACGLLCFSSMAIVQPDLKRAASSYHNHVHYPSELASNAALILSCSSISSHSHRDLDFETVPCKDGHVDGTQACERSNPDKEPSRENSSEPQKVQGNNELSEHCAQIGEKSATENASAKPCSNKTGHESDMENSTLWKADAEAFAIVAGQETSANFAALPMICVDGSTWVDSGGQCEYEGPSAFPGSGENEGENAMRREVCCACVHGSNVIDALNKNDPVSKKVPCLDCALETHLIPEPAKCHNLLVQAVAEADKTMLPSALYTKKDGDTSGCIGAGTVSAALASAIVQSSIGSKTSVIMSQCNKPIVDKLAAYEKADSSASAVVNGSLSVLELLAATYEDSSDSEDEFIGIATKDTEDLGVHCCPDSALALIYADEVGCTVDAPWHCAVREEECAKDDSLDDDDFHYLVTIEPSSLEIWKERSKLFVCKEVMLQQDYGVYEVTKSKPDLEVSVCIDEVEDCKLDVEPMEIKIVNLSEVEATDDLYSCMEEQMHPLHTHCDAMMYTTAKGCLTDGVKDVDPTLLLKSDIYEPGFEGLYTEVFCSKTIDEQVQFPMKLGNKHSEVVPHIVTEAMQLPDEEPADQQSMQMITSGDGECITAHRNTVLEDAPKNDDHGHQIWSLEVQCSAESADGSKPDDLSGSFNQIEAGALQANLKTEDGQLQKPNGEADDLSMALGVKASTAECRVSTEGTSFHKKLQKPIHLPSKSVSRPRFLCLEHALEAYRHLKPLGGSYIVIVCHSGFINIEQRAKDLAEELGLPHIWRSIPFRKASQEEQDFINAALDIEEEGDYDFKDWMVNLGMSVRHSSKSRDRFFSDLSNGVYRDFMASSTGSYPYSMSNDSYDAQEQPSHLTSGLQISRERHNLCKLSKQKKLSVAGRWCGRVWMNNQVHPVLGGYCNAQVPLQPLFPSLSAQFPMTGSADSRPRGRPRKHAVNHGEEVCSEENVNTCAGEVCVDTSIMGREYCGMSAKNAGEGAGETEVGMHGTEMQPDTEAIFLLERTGKKRKVMETSIATEPDISSPFMLDVLNGRKRKVVSDTTDLKMSCLVSDLQRPSSYSCDLSTDFIQHGLQDQGRGFDCSNMFNGKYSSSSDIPIIDSGNNGVSGMTMIASDGSAAQMWQDVTVAGNFACTTTLPYDLISANGTTSETGMHFRRRACSVFDGQTLCCGKEPANQECSERQFTEFTLTDDLCQAMELGGAEGPEHAMGVKRKQVDQSFFSTKKLKEQEYGPFEKDNLTTDCFIATDKVGPLENMEHISVFEQCGDTNVGIPADEHKKNGGACISHKLCDHSFHNMQPLCLHCCGNSGPPPYTSAVQNSKYDLAPPCVEGSCRDYLEDPTESQAGEHSDSSSGSAEWKFMDSVHASSSLTACNGRPVGKIRSKRKKHLGWNNAFKALPDPPSPLELTESSDMDLIYKKSEPHGLEGGFIVQTRQQKTDSIVPQLHHTSFPVEGPSTRLRTRSATRLTKVSDQEAADNASDSMTVSVIKKAQKQPQKKSKKTSMNDTEDESGAYPCDIEGCIMSFSTKQELNMHKRNACTFSGCGKRFGSHKYLLQHRRVHMDDRPLKCLWKGCKMTFKWPWARTEHLRVHTGARPYECPVPGCGQTFRFVSDFSRHKRKTGHTKQ